jgi:hypothetical protein
MLRRMDEFRARINISWRKLAGRLSGVAATHVAACGRGML